MQSFPESEYCTMLYADGRRCRALKMPTRNVCFSHWKQDGQFEEDEAAVAELAARSRALGTPGGVNRALATLFRLTAEGKIPHRKATLLSYQIQLLLYSLGRTRPEAEQVSVPEPIAEELQPVGAAIRQEPGSNGSGGAA